MSEVRCHAPVKSIQLQARVIRANGQIEDLGTIAYWNKSFWHRLLYRLRRLAGRA